MVLIKSLVLAAVAAVVAVAAASSAVRDLGPDNFDKLIKRGKPTFVKFYAPWCGHCKNLAPVYEDLAQSFAHHGDQIHIAKLDADAERAIGKKYDVQGFPTLKYFDGKSDKPEEYEGGRDLESLAAFITEKTGLKPKKKVEAPSSVSMLADDSFPKTIGGAKNVLVAFTAPWCGHCKNLVPTWEKVAAAFANDDEVVIAKVDTEAENSKAVAEEQGVSSYPTIKWFPAGSKEGVLYQGGHSEEAFLEWINEKAGTHRVPGGALDAVAGTVASLNALVAKVLDGDKVADVAAEVKDVENMKAEADKPKEAVDKAKNVVQYKYAQYYVRVLDKLGSNENFASKELTRLDGILSKGGLAPTKRDEIQRKTNVLRRFVEKVAEKAEEAEETEEEAEEKTEEKVEEIKDEL